MYDTHGVCSTTFFSFHSSLFWCDSLPPSFRSLDSLSLLLLSCHPNLRSKPRVISNQSTHVKREREREVGTRHVLETASPLFFSLFSSFNLSSDSPVILSFLPFSCLPFVQNLRSRDIHFHSTHLSSFLLCLFILLLPLFSSFPPSYHLSFNTIESLIHSNGLLSTWTGFKRRRRFIVSPIFSFILSFSRLVPCIFRYRLLSFQILTTGVHEGREEEEKVRTKSKYDSSIIGSKRKDVYKTQRPE